MSSKTPEGDMPVAEEKQAKWSSWNESLEEGLSLSGLKEKKPMYSQVLQWNLLTLWCHDHQQGRRILDGFRPSEGKVSISGSAHGPRILRVQDSYELTLLFMSLDAVHWQPGGHIQPNQMIPYLFHTILSHGPVKQIQNHVFCITLRCTKGKF